MAEHGPHRLSPMLAQYTAVTGQSDPDGRYACGSCMMYLEGGGTRGGCTAVKPSKGEVDGEHIDSIRGGCNIYVRGPAAKWSNVNPNRLTKVSSGYVEDGPFGCARCGNFLRGAKGCVRVMAGKDGVARIEPRECCNAWQRPDEVPRRAVAKIMAIEQGGKANAWCPRCGKSASTKTGYCPSCSQRMKEIA